MLNVFYCRAVTDPIGALFESSWEGMSDFESVWEIQSQQMVLAVRSVA